MPLLIKWQHIVAALALLMIFLMARIGALNRTVSEVKTVIEQAAMRVCQASLAEAIEGIGQAGSSSGPNMTCQIQTGLARAEAALAVFIRIRPEELEERVQSTEGYYSNEFARFSAVLGRGLAAVRREREKVAIEGVDAWVRHKQQWNEVVKYLHTMEGLCENAVLGKQDPEEAETTQELTLRLEELFSALAE